MPQIHESRLDRVIAQDRHAPIIEQIEQWAGALESFDFSCRGQRQPEIVTGIIEQMRQVAADLEREE